MATLAVLAAAAREAEELLNAQNEELEPNTIAEANRRMRLFMQRARQLAR